MPSQTLNLKHNSPQARRLLTAVQDRVTASKKAFSRMHNKWRMAEEEAIAYLPEQEIDRKYRRKREQGSPQYTTLKIPYSYGMLMTSHTYWATVFLSRTPINQFTGRHGESQQQVQAVEALMDYQVQVGEQLVPLYMWLLDVGKYGMGVMHVGWADEFSIVSSIEEVPEYFAGVVPTGRTKRQKLPRRVPGYSGNRLTNIRPYDFYPDPRFPVRHFQKGEFCAARLELGFNTIYKRMKQGYYMEDVVQRLRTRDTTSGGGGTSAERDQGSSQIELPEAQTFFLNDEKSTKRANNILFRGVECTIELIPTEWGLGRGSYPEKWVFTVSEDFNLLLGAQPLGANHDRFEFAVLEYEPEGYALTARGVPEIAKPINDTLDWLVNAHMFNTRKALNDQFIVDPQRVEMGDLADPLPGGVIRLKAGAYGDDVRTAITQLPVNDVTRGHLSDLAAITAIGQRAIGISDQLQGLSAPTGRRSATEVRTSTGFGVNRLKTTSEFFSAMGWAPLAQLQLQNTQQYYETEKKFRIVGQLAQEAGKAFIDVSPESILGFYDFVPIDGTQPIDRIAQATLWQGLFAQLRNFPQILQQYDMGRIFEWVAQLAGLKNIGQFKVELAPDAQLAAQAEAGNVVPLGAGGGGSGNPAPQTPPLNTALGRS